MAEELSEHQIQKEILELLNSIGVYCWRNNSGGHGVWKYGKKGSSDIIGIIKGGIFLAIEVKKEKGIVSKEQQLFLDRINQDGGIGFVARNIMDVRYGLHDYFL